jgi:hypothetical protein
MFKNSVLSAKITQHFAVTIINRFILFKEIIPVFIENLPRHVNIKHAVIKAGGTYTFHSDLKV